MMGFLKRDLFLQMVNLKFYLCFLLAFLLLSTLSDFSANFASIYLVIFSATGVTSLFSYDEVNHWEAYAAAAGGRLRAVDARYVLSILLGLVVFLFQLLLGILNRSNQLDIAILYGSAFFLYAAVVLPISYRFGGTKSRVIMIVAVGLFTGLAAIVTTAFQSSSDSALLSGLSGLFSVIFPVVCLLALAVSHRISRAIMARKEL